MALFSSIRLSRQDTGLSFIEPALTSDSPLRKTQTDSRISCTINYDIRCFHTVAAVSSDWPVASKDAPSKLKSDTTPNYHIFQTTTFLKTWEKTYAPALKAELCLIEVRMKNGSPVVFLPFAVFPCKRTRILSFTDQGVADYSAPVLFDCGIEWNRTQVENLWQQILAVLPAFDFAELSNMPEKIGNLINPLFLLANTENQANSHANILTRSWDEIQQSLVRPKAIRRKLRHLHELGNCEFFIANTFQEQQQLLEFMLHEKQQRFIETHVPGFDQYPEKVHYFNEATKAFQTTGTLHISALKLNGESLACMWGLVSGPHYYGIMIASNLKKWAKYSPGHILHYLLLQHLKDEGYDCLDLGVGDEEWKVQNCDLVIPLRCITITATMRGKLYLYQKTAITYLRSTSFWQALRPLKWRFLRALQR
ncbi:GNAT family N-acetyltransferase [Pseudochrobactrum asaccharolyticum]|uniref:GNAT family N-acetyltransferase n=1 Tax=Pseudochrobactrum asaccharolyticum TaxID=354351 RepID=UPI0040422423